jgi:hypothetical protein
MKKILATFGMGDGNDDISHTRVILVAVAASWLVSKFQHGEPFGTENDRWMLGIILGGGIGKTVAEAVQTTTKES